MKPLDRIRQKMAANGVGALIVSDITNVAWLSGFSGSSAVCLVTHDQAVFITDGRYRLQAGDEVKDLEVEVYQPPTQMVDFIKEHLGRLRVSELGFEGHAVTVQTQIQWSERLGVALSPLKDFVSPLRMIKSPEEVSKVEDCCQMADLGFAHIQSMFKPGITENEIGVELEFFFRRKGYGIAFDFIVASGWRSALPHGRASDKTIESGDFLTLDFGCSRSGYNSDITRTVVIGEPSDRHRDVYGQVLKAQLACLDFMKPGVSAATVDATARMIFAEKGMETAFSHGLGHGLGRLVHDYGRLGTGSEDVLEVGQVWTVEPGVYFNGWGGVRIEDDVVVTEDGVRVLTSSPKELLIFG